MSDGPVISLGLHVRKYGIDAIVVEPRTGIVRSFETHSSIDSIPAHDIVGIALDEDVDIDAIRSRFAQALLTNSDGATVPGVGVAAPSTMVMVRGTGLKLLLNSRTKAS